MEKQNNMEKQIKIEVHAPHPGALVQEEFLVVKVEGALTPRVGARIKESELKKLCADSRILVTQTGVFGSPRRFRA